MNVRDDAYLSRRSFLRFAIVTTATLPLLAACGTVVPGATAPTAPVAARAPAPTPAATTSKLRLPTYVPLQGVKPDLPRSDAGLQAGYFSYPKELVRSVAEPPGKGGDVTAFTLAATSVPPPVDQNAAWQAANKALNANMKVELVPASDYQTKAATTMAGNDLPDLFHLQAILTIANIPQFLKANYADLTPYLSGDAIKSYPNLAAFPTSAWTQMVYDGAIYGVPILRPSLNLVNFVNQTMLDRLGARQPTNGDEYRRILKDATNPQANVFGTAGVSPHYGLQFVGKGDAPLLPMFGAPNNWSVDANGKFTKDIESEQFKNGVGFVRDQYAAGYFFPDLLNTTTIRSNLTAGKYAIAPTGWATYAPMWDIGSKANPAITVRALRPFSVDGSKPVWNRFSGVNGLTAIKKGSPERVQELLSILNFLAAPFGTQEYQLLNFGVPETDFTVDAKGNPILTDRGKADLALASAWQYLAAPMPVLFDSNDPEFARAAYEDEQAFIDVLQADPSLGLYSSSDSSKGGQLTQKFSDGIGEIVTGRSPVSGLDQLLRDWRSGGGDQIRAEYEQAYAARQA